MLTVACRVKASAHQRRTPQRLFEIPNMAPLVNFDVHPDGERFVVVRSVDSESNTTQVNVVLNWLQERAEREPAP